MPGPAGAREGLAVSPGSQSCPRANPPSGVTSGVTQWGPPPAGEGWARSPGVPVLRVGEKPAGSRPRRPLSIWSSLLPITSGLQDHMSFRMPSRNDI